MAANLRLAINGLRFRVLASFPWHRFQLLHLKRYGSIDHNSSQSRSTAASLRHGKQELGTRC